MHFPIAKRLTVRSPRWLAVGAALSLLAAAGPSAAQGLYAGVKGAHAAGRAGAFGAKADDVMAVEYNPAGLARTNGWNIQLGNRFSYNDVRFDRADTMDIYSPGPSGRAITFNEVANQTPLQLLDPLLGVATDFGLKDFGFALAAYAPPGIAHVTFPVGDAALPAEGQAYNGGQRYMMVERNSQILVYALSAAYKFEELFGIGATAQAIVVPDLTYSLVVAPGAPGLVTTSNQIRNNFDVVSTVKGSDYFTFNAIVGAWVSPIPELQFALSGQVIPSELETQSTMTLERADPNAVPRNVTTFRDTDGDLTTTADRVNGNDVTLKIPLPLWGRAAVRFIQPKWDLELDFTYQGWSAVKSFQLSSNNLMGSLGGFNVAIGDITIDKQWSDSFTLALGGDYKLLPMLTVRAGGGYEHPVSQPAYMSVDFMTGRHVHGALGASVYVGPLEISVAYAYRHMIPVVVSEAGGKVYQTAPGATCTEADPNACPYPGKPSATVNGGTYSAFSHMASLDVAAHF